MVKEGYILNWGKKDQGQKTQLKGFIKLSHKVEKEEKDLEDARPSLTGYMGH